MGEMADLWLNSMDVESWEFWLKEHTYCKYCGRKEVFWSTEKKGWRLYDQNSSLPHICSAYLTQIRASIP